MKTPHETLKEFFSSVDNPKDILGFIDVLKDAAFSSPVADVWNMNFRTNVIFYCNQVKLLVETVFIVGKPIIELIELTGDAYDFEK